MNFFTDRVATCQTLQQHRHQGFASNGLRIFFADRQSLRDSIGVTPFHPFQHDDAFWGFGIVNLINVNPSKVRWVGFAIAGFYQPTLHPWIAFGHPVWITPRLKELFDG